MPRKPLPFFIMLLSLAMTTQMLFWMMYYREHANSARALMLQRDTEGIKRERVVILGMLQQVVSDLRALSAIHAVHRYLTSDSKEQENDLAMDFRSFVAHKEIYDQARLLDSRGMERIRIDHRSDGTAASVPRSQLQNKAARYYFRHSYPLDRGEVYISALDLNVEHGQIERPLKPTLRIATPVFDDQDHKRGVIVLNVLADRLFASMQQEQAGMQGSLMLLNPDGYWLKGLRPADEWGFMLPGRKSLTFDRAYPEAARHMQTGQEGQFETAMGIFTYARVPLASGTGGSWSESLVADEPYWMLVSLVPQSKIDAMQHKALADIAWYALPTTLLIVIFAWLLALDREKRLQAADELARLAEHDGLTGLLNRLALSHRLQAEISRAQRYQEPLALLLLDIDHFKQINDQYGHPAGDASLVALAELMQSMTRTSDLVGRYGGEEFLILLPHTNLQQAQAFAERLRSSVERLDVPIGKQDLHMTISIGVAHLEDDLEMDDAGLIHLADEALYEAKAKGRNRVCTAGERHTDV